MSRAAYYYLLFLCFPLCLGDEELYYTLRGVKDRGLIAIVVRLNAERDGRSTGCPETVLLEPHSDQGRASDAKSDEIRLIGRYPPHALPDRTGFTSDTTANTSDQPPTMTITSSGTTGTTVDVEARAEGELRCRERYEKFEPVATKGSMAVLAFLG